MPGGPENAVLRPGGQDNGWLGRGDVFVGIQLKGTAAEHQTTWGHASGLLVLDHECQVDKAGTDHVVCTAVLPLSVLDGSNQGNVRSGRVYSAMYLGDVPKIGEAFADFRFVARIPKDRLLVGVEAGHRVASMTVDGLDSLPYLVFRYFARSAAEDH